jgi:gluconolactonase
MRVVADGLKFPEGPVALANGDVILTEIRSGDITRIAADGRKSLVAHTGGGPNGAALGPDGALYVAQNGGFSWSERTLPNGVTTYSPGDKPDNYIGGQIQRVDLATGDVATLYDSCDGEPLKGPNDLVFDAEGNLYFTDHGKNYGRQRDRTGLFFATADGSTIKEIVWPMEGPNGVGLSPDGKTLYAAETPTARVWAFDLAGPGEVAGRRVVATVPGAPPFNFAMLDSLCVDGDGNILVATLIHGGVTIVAPDGSSTEHHATGDFLTTNCCFGPDLSTLYVTLSGPGQLVAFDNWPTKGLKLNFAG